MCAINAEYLGESTTSLVFQQSCSRWCVGLSIRTQASQFRWPQGHAGSPNLRCPPDPDQPTRRVYSPSLSTVTPSLAVAPKEFLCLTHSLHEGALLGSSISYRGKKRPNSLRGFALLLLRTNKQHAAIVVELQAEVFRVPRSKLLWILRFEKDTANSGYAFHRRSLSLQ